jgi:methanethiol S-methyltransferase
MNYFVFAVAWVLWCGLHSLLISSPATRYLKHQFKFKRHYGRLCYNMIALFTLLPVFWLGHQLRGPILYGWHGPYLLIRLFLMVSAIFLFVAGAYRYDLRQFIGLNLEKTQKSTKAANRHEPFKTGGILNITRHPWYLGGLMLIWGRDLDLATLISNSILSFYLIVGMFLEERRLIASHGDQYRRYQEQVSMLIPFKWAKSRLSRHNN